MGLRTRIGRGCSQTSARIIESIESWTALGGHPSPAVPPKTPRPSGAPRGIPDLHLRASRWRGRGRRHSRPSPQRNPRHVHQSTAPTCPHPPHTPPPRTPSTPPHSVVPPPCSMLPPSPSSSITRLFPHRPLVFLIPQPSSSASSSEGGDGARRRRGEGGGGCGRKEEGRGGKEEG